MSTDISYLIGFMNRVGQLGPNPMIDRQGHTFPQEVIDSMTFRRLGEEGFYCPFDREWVPINSLAPNLVVQALWENALAFSQQPPTKQGFWIGEMQKNPHCSEFYSHLACTLPVGESIALPDGVRVTDRQLCLKALELNRENGRAYYRLAHTLSDAEYIHTPHHEHAMDKMSLYLVSIHFDPTNADAFHILGASLPPNTTLQLLNGSTATAQDLFLSTATAQDLFLQAIQINPNFALAYHSLANTLPENGSIRLFGSMMTKEELFQEAQRLAQ